MNLFKILFFAALGAGFLLYTTNAIKLSKQRKKIAGQEKNLLIKQAGLDRANFTVKKQASDVTELKRDLRTLTHAKKLDSLNYVKSATGFQSVIRQLVNKHKNTVYDKDALIETLKLGLPPKECYNIFGKKVDCKND
jgi:hypothetical protein